MITTSEYKYDDIEQPVLKDLLQRKAKLRRADRGEWLPHEVVNLIVQADQQAQREVLEGLAEHGLIEFTDVPG